MKLLIILIAAIILSGCAAGQRLSDNTFGDIYSPNQHEYEHAYVWDKVERLDNLANENYDSVQSLEKRIKEVEDYIWKLESEAALREIQP